MWSAKTLKKASLKSITPSVANIYVVLEVSLFRWIQSHTVNYPPLYI